LRAASRRLTSSSRRVPAAAIAAVDMEAGTRRLGLRQADRRTGAPPLAVAQGLEVPPRRQLRQRLSQPPHGHATGDHRSGPRFPGPAQQRRRSCSHRDIPPIGSGRTTVARSVLGASACMASMTDYDPFWSGYSYGYRGSYAYGLTGTYPGYSAYGSAPDPFDARGPRGGLRLRIQPKDAEVFVDGYYAGVVDEFDGHFQPLDLVPGPHHVEVYAPGYEPLKFDVNIQPHHTTKYQGRFTPTAR
jgi:hypothetical protein